MFQHTLSKQSRQILSSTNMASMLGLRPASSRQFSTIVPHVYSNAVFMPELFPARLTVPINDVNYDFTCENNTKVSDFRNQVMDQAGEDVMTFELKSAQDSKEADDDKLTMGELKQKKFIMRINGR